MPDISKCPGTGCPLKTKCYRFTAPPTPNWQSYADFTKELEVGEETRCPHYIETRNDQQSVQVRV